MMNPQRLQNILSVTETVLKLILMASFLDLILLTLYTAFLRTGVMQPRFMPFAGLALSLDLFAFLCWWKVRLAAKQGKLWAAYCSGRNMVLLLLLFWVLAMGVYLLNGFRNELHCRTVAELPSILRSGVHPEQIIPADASDIYFREELYPFAPLSVTWRCLTTEEAFLAFAARHGWKPEKTPERTLSYSSRARDGGGIFVKFNPADSMMYGKLFAK